MSETRSQLSCQIENTDAATKISIKGAITEEGLPVSLLQSLRPDVVIDLEGVTRINSLGVRNWVEFVRATTSGRRVVFERCSSTMVRQFSMVPNTLGTARISSLMLPYYCEHCAKERGVLLEVSETFPPEELPNQPCPACREEMGFDDVPAAYFAFCTRAPDLLVMADQD